MTLEQQCVKDGGRYKMSFIIKKSRMGVHNGPKSLILAPQDIPDISGYQLGFGCQCVKAHDGVNPVTNQKIL